MKGIMCYTAELFLLAFKLQQEKRLVKSLMLSVYLNYQSLSEKKKAALLTLQCQVR